MGHLPFYRACIRTAHAGIQIFQVYCRAYVIYRTHFISAYILSARYCDITSVLRPQKNGMPGTQREGPAASRLYMVIRLLHPLRATSLRVQFPIEKDRCGTLADASQLTVLMTVGFRQIWLGTEAVTVFLTVGTDGPQFIIRQASNAVPHSHHSARWCHFDNVSYAPTHLSDF